MGQDELETLISLIEILKFDKYLSSLLVMTQNLEKSGHFIIEIYSVDNFSFVLVEVRNLEDSEGIAPDGFNHFHVVVVVAFGNEVCLADVNQEEDILEIFLDLLVCVFLDYFNQNIVEVNRLLLN